MTDLGVDKLFLAFAGGGIVLLGTRRRAYFWLLIFWSNSLENYMLTHLFH